MSACECGHPVSEHGFGGCVHIIDGDYCECWRTFDVASEIDDPAEEATQ